MGAVSVAQHMTADEFLRLPDTDDLRSAKKAAYEREGLRELWLVDTDAKVVLVFRRSARGVGSFDVALEIDDSLTSPQLDGFELPLVELFPE
jgi:Uma2 family endonuclease